MCADGWVSAVEDQVDADAVAGDDLRHPLVGELGVGHKAQAAVEIECARPVADPNSDMVIGRDPEHASASAIFGAECKSGDVHASDEGSSTIIALGQVLF